jgi:hypothetical protein
VTRPTLRPLSIVDDGADVLVGDPETGTFVALPAIGGTVLRALQRGADLTEVAAEAEREAGEPVDIDAFIEALRELGFVAGGEDRPATRTAPVQQRHWLAGVPQRHARRLFGATAWTCYALSLLFCLACFALRPDLWPRPAEVGRDGVVLTAALVLSLLLGAVHEVWHWLAARALGLSVRFGVDRRLCFLVFETDLSQLWTVPRRQRYGPQLAGLAIDSVQLAALLALRLWAPLPAAPTRLVEALIYVKITTMLWQCLIFLRTDLYGVLVTATGCRDLWRTKTLMLRRAFGRGSPGQLAELAAADPRDVRTAAWFRWLYAAGIALTACYVAYFMLPALTAMLSWSRAGLASTPAHAHFWLTATASALVYLPFLASLALWLSARRARRARRPA